MRTPLEQTLALVDELPELVQAVFFSPIGHHAHAVTTARLSGLGLDAPTRSTGDRLLHLALRAQAFEVAQALLDGGASVRARNHDGDVPLDETVWNAWSPEVLPILNRLFDQGVVIRPQPVVERSWLTSLVRHAHHEWVDNPHARHGQDLLRLLERTLTLAQRPAWEVSEQAPALHALGCPMNGAKRVPLPMSPRKRLERLAENAAGLQPIASRLSALFGAQDLSQTTPPASAAAPDPPTRL